MIAAFCDAHVEFACFKPFAAAATDAAGVKSATDCMRSMLAAFPQKAAAFEELMAGIRHDGENAALKAEVAALKARLTAAEKKKVPPVADVAAEKRKAPPAADAIAEEKKAPPASADVAAEEKKAKRPVSSEKRKPPPAADAEEKKAPPASVDVAVEEKKAKRPVSRKELERFLNAPDTDEDEATTTRRKRDDEGASSTDEEFLPAPAKKQRAPLTQEQRDRKNEKERLRRAALRAQKENE